MIMQVTTVQSKYAASTDEAVEKTAALKTVIVASDFSTGSSLAVTYAKEIAKAFGSEILLVHIQPPDSTADKMDDGFSAAKSQRLADLQELDLIANRLQAEGIKSSSIVRTGSPADLLVQLVAERKPDLLLMGAYGFRTANRSTLGSTAEFLLRSLNCPVLVVGPSVKERPSHLLHLSKVVYASALPEAPHRAQVLVRELTRRFAGHVHIVHVEPHQEAAQPHTDLRNLEMKEEKIADSFRRCGVGSSWTLRFGSQSDHILEQAKVVSADLICFGIAHSATSPSQMGLLTAIIRSATCPVLTVPGIA
jgi:nucleotide-binding universal stress UspA family protein